MTVMDQKNYDDPLIEEQWLNAQRVIVGEYLHSQCVKHGQIGEIPAWFVAPHASIWAIESLSQPDWIGWWVICGDLPTDYISAADVLPPQHPRKAMRVFAEEWLKQVDAWNTNCSSDPSQNRFSTLPRDLAPLLVSRAKLLKEWAENDSLWGDD